MNARVCPRRNYCQPILTKGLDLVVVYSGFQRANREVTINKVSGTSSGEIARRNRNRANGSTSAISCHKGGAVGSMSPPLPP